MLHHCCLFQDQEFSSWDTHSLLQVLWGLSNEYLISLPFRSSDPQLHQCIFSLTKDTFTQQLIIFLKILLNLNHFGCSIEQFLIPNLWQLFVFAHTLHSIAQNLKQIFISSLYEQMSNPVSKHSIFPHTYRSQINTCSEVLRSLIRGTQSFKLWGLSLFRFQVSKPWFNLSKFKSLVLSCWSLCWI